MDRQFIVILILGFTVVTAILSIVTVLLLRSNATVSSDLLGAIVGYLFADLKIVLLYFFYRRGQDQDQT